MTDARFQQGRARAAFFQHEPVRPLIRPVDEQQLFIRFGLAEVAYACRRETSAANYAVTRSARPTCFDHHGAHSKYKLQECADHRRVAKLKAMGFAPLDAYARAATIGAARVLCEGSEQPIGSSRARKVVRLPEREIFRHISAPVRTRPLFRLGQNPRPLFIKLAHKNQEGKRWVTDARCL